MKKLWILSVCAFLGFFLVCGLLTGFGRPRVIWNHQTIKSDGYLVTRYVVIRQDAWPDVWNGYAEYNIYRLDDEERVHLHTDVVDFSPFGRSGCTRMTCSYEGSLSGYTNANMSCYEHDSFVFYKYHLRSDSPLPREMSRRFQVSRLVPRLLPE